MAKTEIERAQYVLYGMVQYIVCDNIQLDLSGIEGKPTDISFIQFDAYWPDLFNFICIQDSVI